MEQLGRLLKVAKKSRQGEAAQIQRKKVEEQPENLRLYTRGKSPTPPTWGTTGPETGRPSIPFIGARGTLPSDAKGA